MPVLRWVFIPFYFCILGPVTLNIPFVEWGKILPGRY